MVTIHGENFQVLWNFCADSMDSVNSLLSRSVNWSTMCFTLEKVFVYTATWITESNFSQKNLIEDWKWLDNWELKKFQNNILEYPMSTSLNEIQMWINKITQLQGEIWPLKSLISSMGVIQNKGKMSSVMDHRELNGYADQNRHLHEQVKRTVTR